MQYYGALDRGCWRTIQPLPVGPLLQRNSQPIQLGVEALQSGLTLRLRLPHGPPALGACVGPLTAQGAILGEQASELRFDPGRCVRTTPLRTTSNVMGQHRSPLLQLAQQVLDAPQPDFDPLRFEAGDQRPRQRRRPCWPRRAAPSPDTHALDGFGQDGHNPGDVGRHVGVQPERRPMSACRPGPGPARRWSSRAGSCAMHNWLRGSTTTERARRPVHLDPQAAPPNGT